MAPGSRKRGDIVVTPTPAELNLSHAAFHLWARQFLEASKHLPQTQRVSPVPYRLLGRALELELKARHLIHNGQQTIKEKYRHNLLKAYDGLPPNQKILTPDERDVLRQASDSYNDPNKFFDYWNPRAALSGFPCSLTKARCSRLLKNLWMTGTAIQSCESSS
jgi:hypothetical protein